MPDTVLGCSQEEHKQKLYYTRVYRNVLRVMKRKMCICKRVNVLTRNRKQRSEMMELVGVVTISGKTPGRLHQENEEVGLTHILVEARYRLREESLRREEASGI
jgi:hypothetical protein